MKISRREDKEVDQQDEEARMIYFLHLFVV
jgi:hypothetical protein